LVVLYLQENPVVAPMSPMNEAEEEEEEEEEEAEEGGGGFSMFQRCPTGVQD